MQNLKTDIKKTVIINESDLITILNHFSSVNFKKKEAILSFGKVSNYFQFIENGLIRVYFFDNDAREVTVQIGIDSMWVNNLYSFLSQTPSEYYIEALEPTTLLQIQKTDLERLFAETPIIETFFRLKIQQAYCRLQDRTLNQMNKSAEERYLEFKAKYGQIEPLVPQYIIASYLNISPEHLSKIRSKLAKS